MLSDERLRALLEETYTTGDFPDWFPIAMEHAFDLSQNSPNNVSQEQRRKEILDQMEIDYPGFHACVLGFDALFGAFLSLEPKQSD